MNNIEHKFIIDRKGRMLLENANIVLGALIDKNKKLQKENEKLKEQLKELKKEYKEYKETHTLCTKHYGVDLVIKKGSEE